MFLHHTICSKCNGNTLITVPLCTEWYWMYTDILYLHAVHSLTLTHSPQNNMLNEFKIKYRIFLSEVKLTQFLL